MGRGWGWRGHFLHLWGGGWGGKLANEGQKGLREENYFFKTFLRQTTPGDRPLRPSLPRFPGAPTHPPSEPLPTLIRGLVATPRRRNRTSSHVSRVSRGPARPSPMARQAPSAGLRVRAPGSMRLGALAGRPAGVEEARLRTRGPGCGRARLAPGRAFWLLELVWNSRCFIYYDYFLNGQAHPRPSPKGAEMLLGAGAASRGLLACGTTARRRAAILSPWLMSLGGWGGVEAELCAIAPTVPDVGAAGGAGPGDPQLCSEPR